jgi:glycosyltransferase involved in cell wall biosynthesis
VAAHRLMEALNNNGVKAKMLVAEKTSDSIPVAGMQQSLAARWHFLWERWCIFCHLRFSRQHLFDIDIANSGFDITRTPEFREADVVHIHWVNQGMLSLKSVRKILRSGKPVVWTMHDLWPATAICHYARTCDTFKTGCHNCPLLPGHGSVNDLARRVWKRKKRLYAKSNIRFVACSRWLEGEAKQSALMKGLKVTSIPNAIDTHTFHPADKRKARQRLNLPEDKRVILFVSQKVTDERKGMPYFVEAMQKLIEQHPDLRDNTVVALLGSHSDEMAAQMPVPAFPLGYVANEKSIASVYNAADAYVLPSLEDNLPNTIMEAMACGVPCVGFRVGGIPEMIDHQKNGYVARFKDSADLAEGLYWTLNATADSNALSKNAVTKVAQNYSQQSVAVRYTEVYNELIALKRYII